MDLNQVKLEQDLSEHMDRIGPGVRELFNTYKFYYIHKFPIKELLSNVSADLEGLVSREIATKFYNINYRMLEHQNECEWIDWFTYSFYYLVTSFDEEGIKVPLNFYERKWIHPGGKRVCIGAYLGMDTIPVLLQTKKKHKPFNFLIRSFDELERIYPSNNFTGFIRETYSNHQPLEIHYLESMIKTQDNIDGWMEQGRGILDQFNQTPPPFQFLKHGLNVVNNNIEGTTEEKGLNGYVYKTVFSKEPMYPYYIKVNDSSLLTQNFWKLVYYFDPRYRVKYSEKKELEIRNTHNFATKSMNSNHILKTLCKKKRLFKIDAIAPAWKLRV